ncbi:MAG: lamin tail domain-containing protein [Planctomycetota bacterium]
MRVILATLGICALLALPAQGDVYLNEVLGSTTSTDTEFIELYNSGPDPVDITGWSIELWDSDAGDYFGLPDGGSPYIIDPATLGVGGYYLLANPEFLNWYTEIPDQAIQANAIENSSYTMILKDAGLATIYSAFVTDGGDGDAANDAGTPITPDLTFGPDGTYLPAGYYLIGDGGPTAGLLEFDPRPAPSATPGYANIPEPASLLLLGLAGLLIRRR